MRWTTLFLIAVGVAALAVVGWILQRKIQETREWKQLLALDGKEFFWDPGDTTPEYLFGKWAPRRQPVMRGPVGVVRLQDPADGERILLFELVGDTTPVNLGHLVVNVLDGNRRVLSWSDVFTGMKIDHHRIDATKRGDLGHGTFEVEVSRGFRDPTWWQRQVYVLVEDLPVLVRVEDQDSQMEQVEYERVPNCVGTALPVRTPEEWERSLSSPQLAEVLRTLIWLGGHHGDLADPPSKFGEPPDAARVFHETKARPGVRSKLAELAKHPHPWVAEASKAVRD